MRWRSWAERSEVERVDFYTRQSFYVLLWGMAGLFLFSAIARIDDTRDLALVLGVALATTGTATAVLREVMDLHPRPAPIPWRTVGPFLVVSGVALGCCLLLEGEVRIYAMAITWSAMAWSLSGLRQRSATVALLVVLTAAPATLSGRPQAALGGLAFGLFCLFTVRVSLWLLQVVTELDGARRAQSALAVAEERLRFSRDVHDVLGRRLSTIAVQAELAATLAQRGDDRAAPRMLEVRGIAHEALREARELARGYRPTDLDQELRGARSLLHSAGIETRVDLDDLPTQWREATGWVVREAVTNVLRHPRARQVWIEYVDGVVHVGNDGSPADRHAEPGSGITGLAERLTPLGAGLDVVRSEDRFVLQATLPAQTGRSPGPPAEPADPTEDP